MDNLIKNSFMYKPKINYLNKYNTRETWKFDQQKSEQILLENANY